MRKLLLALLLFILSLDMIGCSKHAGQHEQGMKIVTSFYPIYSMVKEIAGEVNDVRMIQSGNGIHSFEPSANDVAAIYDSDVFVYHSRTLESWAGALAPNVQQSSVKIIEASQGMTLDKVTGLEEVAVSEDVDEKTLYDPHTWLDPDKVVQEARIIAQQLSEMDPEHKELYWKNAARLNKEAQILIEKYQPIFDKVSHKTFVTQHTAFSYLAKRFNLEQLGIAGISPEQEPSPRQLAEIEEFIKRYKVKTIFVESDASSKVAATLVQSTGVELKTLNPLERDPDNGKSYLENLEENLAILVKELKE